MGRLWCLGTTWARTGRLIAIAATLVVALSAFPAAAGAQSAPFGYTDAPQITGAQTASLQGDVTTGDLDTTYQFQYADSSSEWCTTYGSSGSPADSVPSSPPTISGDISYQIVSADVSGLTAGASYCYDLVVSNSDGSDNSNFTTFTSGAPSADTYDAFPTGTSTAQVDGDANPSGQSTQVEVQYGPADSTWCTSGGSSGSPASTSAPQTLNSTGTDYSQVSLTISGLTGGQQYCAAVAAVNASGTAFGGLVVFTAGAPTAQTDSAFATGASTAEVDGSVNPTGQSTSFVAEYDTADSTWCQSYGTSGSAANSTTAQTLSSTDSTDHNVSVDLTGLIPGTSYCAEIVATNDSATSTLQGAVTFTAGDPTASTYQAFPTGASTAEVDGTVNPAGQSTTYLAQYDTSDSAWCQSGGTSGSAANSTTAQTLSSTDSTDHNVSVDLTGLIPGTSYCAEIVAKNGSGTSPLTYALTFSAGTPTAYTYGASVTGATTAEVDGDVNPVGQTTTYLVQYDTSDSAWCQSGGTSGSAANSTTAQTLSSTDVGDHYVTVDLTGLTGGTSYCAEIVASNDSGNSPATYPVTFTAGTPTADTYKAFATGGSTAEVDGTVNPAGQSTSYLAEYDTSDSAWCQSGGTSGSAASSTSSQTLSATDSTDHEVTVNLSGLTAGQSYCVAIVASNTSGTSALNYQVSFTAGTPSATTDNAFATGGSTAEVDGTVNPAGQTTNYVVQYDTADSAWCQNDGMSGSASHSTSAQELFATDSSDHSVSVVLTGLTVGTSYCAEIVATNDSGSSPLTYALTFTAGTPQAITDGATGTSPTDEQITGEVNPAGQSTAYEVQYGPGSSAWCVNGGSVGSPANTTTAQTLSSTDSSSHSVSVDISGLTTGDDYCAQLVATNLSGTSDGGFTYFTAGISPTVTQGSATSLSSTSEKLTGTVNPNGESTAYQFDYAPNSSTWCTSDGATGSPTQTTSTTAGSGTSAQDVTATVSGLTSGSTYCWALEATNPSGTSVTTNDTFTTGSPTSPPTVTRTSATSVSSTSETLAGTVNPNGESTMYQFEYAPSSSAWCTSGGSSGSPSTTSSQSAGSGTTAQSESATVTGLTASTDYCWDLTATNTTGTSTTTQGTFTTASPPSAPTVSRTSATSVSSTSETLAGTVNPNGQSTTYQFEYASSSSAWCTSGGSSGAPSSTSSQSAGSGTSAQSESATVTGLTASTQYCWALTATNTTGTSTTSQGTFTTAGAAPTVTRTSATSVSSTSETLAGTVNPNGQSTTYQFEYAPSTSTWCTSGGSSGSPSQTSSTSAGSGSSAQSESATITGLTASTGYCWDLTATNTTGTSKTTQGTFTTASPPSAPTVTRTSATSVSSTSETLAGTVNPNGESTTYQFEYAPSSSAWCTSGGSSGSPSTTSSQSAGSGTTAQSESATLTGLTASTDYCWDLTATNTTGTSTTTQGTFTTADAPPPSYTLTVKTTGAGSGTVAGSGISCPGGCSKSYSSGTSVTLTATAASGSHFVGWSGDCSGTAGCTVSMTGNKTVTAEFDKNPPPPSCTLKSLGSKVHLKKSTSTSKAGTLKLTATCSQAATAKLAGILTELVKKKGSSKTSKKTFHLSAPSTSIASAGGSVTLVVKLPKAALKGLKAKYRESAKFTLTATNANGSATATASISRIRGIK